MSDDAFDAGVTVGLVALALLCAFGIGRCTKEVSIETDCTVAHSFVAGHALSNSGGIAYDCVPRAAK